jgi:acyl carrier protein
MVKEESIDFYNMYGPTECTIDATITKVTNANSIPHIGKPVLNTEIYLLDEKLDEVPPGTPGEIYIAGKCLAEGYLGNEELTNQKFIYTSIGSRQNIRLYRSGDLARYLPDGTIEYIGRTDNQVKIRGYRIEIKEIEAVLHQLPCINDVIVKVIEKKSVKDPASHVLVAYLLLQPETALDLAGIKNSLLQKLPEYMVPSAFVPIDHIPLTNNGKTDYNALPLPDWNDNVSAADKPCGELSLLEKYIIDVWKEQLNVEGLKVTDNYFEMGGHSLGAMQITAELQEYFETDIPLISLFFEGPTARDLARAIEENLEDPAELPEILAEITGSDS